MPEEPGIHVDLPATPDLTPIHDRLSSVEQQVPDLRERMARAETSIKETALHNPVGEEALRLAGEAHQLATQALEKVKKAAREVAPPAPRVVEDLPPPAPLADPVQHDPPPLDNPAPRNPFWKRWI